MRIPLSLLLLATALPGQENRLDPPYPFKTCRITFKPLKSGAIEGDGVVYIKGPRSIGIFRRSQDGKLKETVHRGTAGTWVFEVATDASGAVTGAKRQRHPSYFLKADLAGLSEDEAKKLGENLPILWRKLAPAFNVDDWGVRAPLNVTGSEEVAGKTCEVAQYQGKGPERRLWRWQGTDIILKQATGSYVAEAAKVEENAVFPESVFDLPRVMTWEAEVGDFDRQRAREVFKALVGREAEADPGLEPPKPGAKGAASAVKLEGSEYQLKDVFVGLNIEEGEFEVYGGDPPSVSVQVRKVPAKKVADLAGKEYPLGSPDDDDANTLAFALSDNLRYESKKATLKVVSVAGGVVEFEADGAFMKLNDQEKEVRLQKVRFRARVRED